MTAKGTVDYFPVNSGDFKVQRRENLGKNKKKKNAQRVVKMVMLS